MRALRLTTAAVILALIAIVGGCVALPSLLHALNPGVIYRVPNSAHTVFLTLDDGPSDSTETILAVLRKHNVKATFFIIADHIRPELMEKISFGGHRIAHHMKSAAKTAKMTETKFQADFLETDRALSRYAAIKLFRPPDGTISPLQENFVRDQAYKTVVGTMFPLDHWLRNRSVIVKLTKLLAVDGGIIILHDTASRGQNTAAVLDELIPALRNKGYKFGDLGEALGTGGK